MKSQLQTRIISSIIAIVILICSFLFFKEQGLYVVCYLIAARGIFEAGRLLFASQYPKNTKTFFSLVVIAGFVLMSSGHYSKYSYEILISFFSIATIYGILFHKFFSSIDSIFTFIAKFMLGAVYAASLPAMILSLFKIEQGLIWFACLLSVIFAGDIGAYAFGTLFGKTKLAPELSPKKSLQGSLGGILFSIAASIVFTYFLPSVSIWIFIALGLFGGIFGQIGDFFESLVKRIAGVKDSGSIMPGHGGVLDRLDGVYFASPLFYIVIHYII